MFRKIILPVVILIFTQQNFYGMKNTEISINNEEEKENKLGKDKWWEFLKKDMEKSTCLSYHIRALFNNFFRKWCGVYKRVKLSYGELYFGTVNGIGWYPQFLNFHDHFRMGFFELSYNFITTIYHIAIYFFTKGEKIVFKNSLLCGLSFNIINFKIYKGLIRLNFINPGHLFGIYCENFYHRGFCASRWTRGGKQIPWSMVLYFGKELKSVSEIKEALAEGNTTWQKKKELLTKIFFLILNCVLLPEIYFDISFFNSSR